ncbi:PUA-like domain-containing protein [Fomitopsis serialis]|uniref:PUA-like domain-containing protein n=1 Tax=Fomitopsis serialis TaxID=139415 RepID=UPI002007FFCB|nr:PUA-like domain-containing protein [Neoantrodia serialis]KAH9917257.1 PUA-like domain-containing protein [Neoantrodia serialis]
MSARSPARAGRTHSPNVFGHIPDVPIGTYWASRQECSDAAVHPFIAAGIYGTKEEGAYSIVLSGGYEDDVDEGDRIIYTGSGGNDKALDGTWHAGPQTKDQTFDNYRNAALWKSWKTGEPVRVVRGCQLDSDFAPPGGDKKYRYDGLYEVVRASLETGKSGFKVCRFELKRFPNQPPIPRREGTYTFRPLKQRRGYSPIPEPKYEGTPIPAAPQAGPSSLPSSPIESSLRLESRSAAPSPTQRGRETPSHSPIEGTFTALRLSSPHPAPPRDVESHRNASPAYSNAPRRAASHSAQPRRWSASASTAPTARVSVDPDVSRALQSLQFPYAPDPKLKALKFKKKSET